MTTKKLKYTSNSLAAFIAAFGLITFITSSFIIFDLFDFQSKQGDYVLFVVVANFISSILYLIAVYGIIKSKIWTTRVLSISVIMLFTVLLGLFIHINSGGLYETKTIGAMIFRITLSLLFALSSYLLFKRMKNES